MTSSSAWQSVTYLAELSQRLGPFAVFAIVLVATAFLWRERNTPGGKYSKHAWMAGAFASLAFGGIVCWFWWQQQQQQQCIAGKFVGLELAGGGEGYTDQIVLESMSTPYFDKRIPRTDSTTFDLEWRLFGWKRSSITFVYQRTPGTDCDRRDIPVSERYKPRSEGHAVEQPFERRFVLDLSKIPVPIEIHIGRGDNGPSLYYRDHNERRIQIAFEDAGGVTTKRGSLFPLFGQRVFAQEKTAITPQNLKILMDQLGSEDLNIQLAAREHVRKDHGSDVYGFVRLALADPSSGIRRDKTILIHNLEELVRSHEASGVKAPLDVLARLAELYSEAGQHAKASFYFDRAGDGPVASNAPLLYLRGYSYYQAGMLEKAIASLRQSLAVKMTEHAQIYLAYALRERATQRTNGGASDLAIHEFNESIGLLSSVISQRRDTNRSTSFLQQQLELSRSSVAREGVVHGLVRPGDKAFDGDLVRQKAARTVRD